MSELIIRSIAKDDVFACLSIYNYEVIHGVATLDLEPRTLEEWHEWYNAHSDEHHPIIVGTIDDVVVGYASLSPYRLKDAFKSTVELSIYAQRLPWPRCGNTVDGTYFRDGQSGYDDS